MKIVFERLIAGILGLVLVALLTPSFVIAGPEVPFTRQEFETLAKDLAPKVNLFRDVWKADPQAEFFGGTSRDFLYWLRSQFAGALTKAQARQVAKQLRSRQIIDVREFILFESDVDVISSKNHLVDGSRYGIKKIDQIAPERLDPATSAGQDEMKQGYIPAEKIRLGPNGLAQAGAFGDGVGEIFESRPTVVFASQEAFETTRFAKLKLNHPVLLALRYIRILAVDHFQRQGRDYPNAQRLVSTIDPVSAQAVKDVIDQVLKNEELRPYLDNPKFKLWLNLAIQKAFRSYTNPTAAKMLMEHFRADRIPRVYEGLEPINQYLFVKHRDEAKIAAEFKRIGVRPSELFEKPEKFFPDGMIYHGTRTEAAFRSILFQGILPSGGGSAGDGLYGVAIKNQQFSESWGGTKDRLVRLPISADARIVDVRTGLGARLLKDFNGDYSKFAEAFGIDIIAYPYSPEAYIVKNAKVLGKAQGVHRVLLPFEELRRFVRVQKKISIFKFMTIIHDNGLNEEEADLLKKDVDHDLDKTIRSKTFAQWMTDPEFLHVLKNLRSNMIVLTRELLKEEIARLDPKKFADRPQWLKDFGMYNQNHQAVVDQLIHERAVELIANDAGLSKRKTMDALLRNPSLSYLTSLQNVSILNHRDFKVIAETEIANWPLETVITPPKAFAAFTKFWEDHNVLLGARKARAKVLLTELLAGLEAQPLAEFEKNPRVIEAVRLSAATGVFVSLLEFDVFKKSLEMSNRHWNVSRAESFYEKNWNLEFKGSDATHLMRAMRERIDTQIAAWDIQKLGKALGAAHRADNAFLYFNLWGVVAHRLGKPELADGFLGRIGKSIRDFAYDRQNKLIDPAIMLPELMVGYVTEVVKQESKKQKSRGGESSRKDRAFELLQVMNSYFRSPTNSNHPLSVEISRTLGSSEYAGVLAGGYQGFPKQWSEMDRAITASLDRLGDGRASEEEKAVLKQAWINHWFPRILKAPANEVSPEALIGAYLIFERPERIGSGNNTFLDGFAEWDALIRMPQLRNDPRGVEVMEAVIATGHFNERSKNVPGFRKHIADAVKGVWADHPRAEVWRKALSIPRNHPDGPGQGGWGTKRKENSKNDRAEFLRGVPMNRGVRCELMFRSGSPRKWGRYESDFDD